MVAGVMPFNRSDGAYLALFTKMMVRDRFLGSAFGVVWAILTPVLMLGIFTFVFGFVFRSKLPGAETSLSYVIWLISGYGPWLGLSEGIMSSTVSVTSNAQLIKNMPVRVALLPIAGSLMGLISLAVSMVFLVVLLILSGSVPDWSWAIVPGYIIVQLILVAGIGLILSGFNVFVRDVAHIMPNILLIVMFASPIFYSIKTYPSVVQRIMEFNPIYLIAEGYRQPLIYGQLPPVWQLPYCLGVALVIFFIGYRVFNRLSRYFDSRL